MGNLASMQTKPFQAIGHASRMAAEIKTNLPFEPGGQVKQGFCFQQEDNCFSQVGKLYYTLSNHAGKIRLVNLPGAPNETPVKG